MRAAGTAALAVIWSKCKARFAPVGHGHVELTDAEVDAACPMPSGAAESVCEATPVGIWVIMDPGKSPAEEFGGSWVMRTDTHLFMGCCVWKRVGA